MTLPDLLPIRTLTVRTAHAHTERQHKQMNKRTNERTHGHRCLHCALLCNRPAHAIYMHAIFTYLTDWITSYGHESIDFKEKLLLLLLSVIVWHSIAIAYYMPCHGNRHSHRCALILLSLFRTHYLSLLLRWWDVEMRNMRGMGEHCKFLSAIVRYTFMCEFYELYIDLPWSAEVRICTYEDRSRVYVCLRNMHHTIDWQSMCVLIFQHNR